MPLAPLLVLHVPAGGGHKAAALAIAEAARAAGRPVEVLDALAFAPRWFARAYVQTHLLGSQYAPALYGNAFNASNHVDPARDAVRAALDRALGGKMIAYVRRRAPWAVVCTHFYPLVELGRLRREGVLHAPLAAVVTDYVAHAVWSSPGVDLYCTTEGRSADDMRTHGLHGAALAETGIPVNPRYRITPAWAPPKPGQPINVLITSGGFGVGPVNEVLRGFRGVPGVWLDVVCGNRPELVRQARKLVARWGLTAQVTGFANDMPARMARAHVVVGKSGGLTMSECLAAGRPLITIGAAPGQEGENERTLLAWGAGVSTRSTEVGALVTTLAREDALGGMAERARAHGKPLAAQAILGALRELAGSGAPSQRMR